MEIFAQRYRITGQLGKGAFGTVYRAVDKNLGGHEVALKLLNRGEEVLAVTEAGVLKALSSDHILPVLNAGVHNDVPFIVTEIANYGTAESKLKQCPHGLDVALAIRWTRHVLTALEYCHRRGVLHRDVTPNNIFLDNDDHVRLGDFGIAVSIGNDGTAPRRGNQHVTAPEGFETGRLTLRSEVYSVGASLWRLLTGIWPYEAADEAELLRLSKLERRPQLAVSAPHIPRSVGLVLSRSLRPDPGARYQDAASFRTALGNCTLSSRDWAPVAPHPGHLRCWIGRFASGPVDVCVQQEGNRRFAVEARRSKTGHRLNEGCGNSLTRAELQRILRRVFASL